jgi:hypothetical protein
VEAPVVSACKDMQEDTTTTINLGWVVFSYVGTGGDTTTSSFDDLATYRCSYA